MTAYVGTHNAGQAILDTTGKTATETGERVAFACNRLEDSGVEIWTVELATGLSYVVRYFYIFVFNLMTYHIAAGGVHE